MPLITLPEWEAFLSRHPEAHLLQTATWGALKASFGWEVTWLVTAGADSELGAQVLFRRLPLGLSLGYIPKGPVGAQPTGKEQNPASWQEFLSAVDLLCAQRRAVLLKVEPDSFGAAQIQDGFHSGFRPGEHAIQPQRSILVDLDGDEGEILARMKQKTRYNIRLAEKKGVRVQPDSDLEGFYRLMQATGRRDRFEVHSLDYYRKAYELFSAKKACELLFAEFEGQPLAALMVFAQGERAWYLYGASSDSHRELMPAYLLQWEAMRWARARGCTCYDLWGVPDADEETLEAHFAERSDGLWGVYRFKRGFGGQLTRAAGSWDRVYQPVLYRFYSWWVSRGAGFRG
jgi:lipid II:glycine glycyltransferase (peptidoglycan interpeptide bridge formation enzyme)